MKWPSRSGRCRGATPASAVPSGRRRARCWSPARAAVTPSCPTPRARHAVPTTTARSSTRRDRVVPVRGFPGPRAVPAARAASPRTCGRRGEHGTHVSPGPAEQMRYREDAAAQGFVEWFHTRQKTGSRTDRALLGFPSSWWLPGECPLPRRSPRFRAPWTGPENQEWAPIVHAPWFRRVRTREVNCACPANSPRPKPKHSSRPWGSTSTPKSACVR